MILRSEASALDDYRISRLSRILVWAVGVSVGLLITWAYYAEIDQLVRSDGRVIPSGQVRVIQSLEGGIISQIHVREGQAVEKGQPLIQIDDTQFAARFKENQARLSALNLRLWRLDAEREERDLSDANLSWGTNEQAMAEQEISLFLARSQRQKDALAVAQRQVDQQEEAIDQAQSQLQQSRAESELAQKELTILKPLFDQGVVSQVELLRAEKEKVIADGQVKKSISKVAQARALTEELIKKKQELRSRFKAEIEREYNQALSDKQALEEVVASWQDKVERTDIRSPVAGVIQQVLVNTIGGVASPGMDLITVVPADEQLIIEAEVRPADIAYLRPGQSVRVRLSAYDFTQYGSLEGQLTHISADALVDPQGRSYFLVKANTHRSYLLRDGEKLPILPGMIAELDILTGKRSLLDYVAKPIIRAQHIALREQ